MPRAKMLAAVRLMDYCRGLASTAGVDHNRLAHDWGREYVVLNPMSVFPEVICDFLITYGAHLYAWRILGRFPTDLTH